MHVVFAIIGSVSYCYFHYVCFFSCFVYPRLVIKLYCYGFWNNNKLTYLLNKNNKPDKNKKTNNSMMLKQMLKDKQHNRQSVI